MSDNRLTHLVCHAVLQFKSSMNDSSALSKDGVSVSSLHVAKQQPGLTTDSQIELDEFPSIRRAIALHLTALAKIGCGAPSITDSVLPPTISCDPSGLKSLPCMPKWNCLFNQKCIIVCSNCIFNLYDSNTTY